MFDARIVDKLPHWHTIDLANSLDSAGRDKWCENSFALLTVDTVTLAGSSAVVINSAGCWARVWVDSKPY